MTGLFLRMNDCLIDSVCYNVGKGFHNNHLLPAVPSLLTKGRRRNAIWQMQRSMKT